MAETSGAIRELPAVTPDVAKEVWQSLEKAGVRPSGRAVAKAIAQSGRYLPPCHRTITRWENTNWASRRGSAKLHPMHEATKELEIAIPVLTGDPLTRVSDLAGKPPRIDVESLRKEIESFADDALIRRAARELCVSVIILMKCLQVNAPLVETMPGAVGTLMLASARAFFEAIKGFKTMLDVTDRNKRRPG